ncbi:MAG: GNAT family N-acetyltransferase [Rhizomicrobium sp.]
MTEDELNRLNARLLAYLRAAAERRPSARRAGPFLATFDDDPNVYLNYAIPDDGIAPDAAQLADLVALFEARGRKPRLEYITGAAPQLESALLAYGFRIEKRVPVMLCRPGMQQPAPQPDGLLVFAATADEDLVGAEQAQAEAYGSPSRGPRGLKRTLRHGGVVAAARDVASGAIVGGGIATPPLDGISEIAGIGMREAFRRRGGAAALTALLAYEAFARGIALLWLTPEDASAERIYARAGFAAVSEALHISL